MSKVTFPCEHCGKVTAVRTEFLGKQVRCPHCQQVITAPAAGGETGPPILPSPGLAREGGSPPPGSPGREIISPVPVPQPQELVISVPPPVVEESIFDPEDETGGDSLFASPSKPLIELPPETPGSPLSIEAADPGTLDLPNLQIEAGLEPAPSGEAGHEPLVAYVAENAPASDTGLNFTAGLPAAEVPSPGMFAGESDLAGPSPAVKATAARAARGGMLVPTLLIFLIPYCIFSSIAVVLLYMKKQQPSLEVLPDDYSEKKLGGPGKVSIRQRTSIDNKVPARLVGKLNQTLQVGDLEIVPKKVEWLGADRIGLLLQLRDLSTEVEFNPVSDLFLRFNRLDRNAPRPYTFLEEVGTRERLYAGSWQTYQKGQPFDGRLKPGDVMTAQLTTAVRDGALVKRLKGYSGALLWRVQVRRGFVEYKGQEYSTTAVVGVEFKVGDIQKGSQEAG